MAFVDKAAAQPPRTAVFTAPPPPITQPTVSTPLRPVRHSTPPPPAVPALRIVKRAKRFGHEKSSSSGSVSSTEEPGAPDVAAISTAAPQRQAPATYITSSQPTRLVSTVKASGPSRVAVAPAQPAPNKLGTGPRRVLITDKHATTASAPNGRVVVAPTNTTGPRRVPIAAPASVVAPAVVEPVAKASTVSGLRAPAKYGAIGVASALPRPVSRLPAPTTSGIGRLRGANGTGAGGGSGIVAPGKGVPARRLMYGGP